MDGNSSDNNFKYLNQILTQQEICSLTSCVRIKIESHLEGKQLSINNMKNQLDNTVANTEKKSFTFDREVQKLQSKLSMSEDFADKLKTQLKKTEEALQKSRHEYYDILQCRDALSYDYNVYKEKADRFAAEKLDLTDLLDRRLEDIKCLQTEINRLSSKLQVNSDGRIESNIKTEEIELRMLSLQHQEMRMSQERQFNQKQVATLNEEINQKLNELSTLRRERATQIFELQSSLEQKNEEHGRCIEEVKHLKLVLDKKDKHIDSLATRMKEMQQYCVQLEEDYQNEITAQNNLIELHKQSSNDFKKKNETLVETIEEMQTILQSAKQAHTELETIFNESQLKFSQQINTINEEKAMLRKELEEMKQTTRETLEEQIEKYFPAAAATNKILRSNISLSYIYSEYVRVQQLLEDEKCENARLKENMQALVLEAQENAPLLNRKIHEHQKALQTIVDLQKQVSILTENNEKSMHEMDTLVRMNNQFQREIKRFELENLDLSKQIRHLIKNLEEARGFNVSFEREDVIFSPNDYNSRIPDALITFSGIEDLQTKNKQLMRSLREANEKIESLEREDNDELKASLQKNLDDALIQLEHLKSERRQQTEMVEALVQQKDLYKLMANHSSETNQQRSPVAYPSATFSSSTRVNDEYNELKLNFDKIKAEYANYCEENVKKLAELRESNDKLRDELSAFKIESVKISSELSFTQNKLQMFMTNMEQFQRENAILRERNTVLNETVKKHEQSIVSMRSDILSTQDNLHRHEIANESLKAERDMYRNNELKLLQEKETMIRDNANQNRLISTLQSVNNNLDKLETNTINILAAQLEKAERECVYLRNKCETEQLRYNEVNKLLEKNLENLHEKFDTENSENEKTDLDSPKIDINELTAQLTTSQSENENLQKSINELSVQLTSSQSENESLKKAISQLSDQLTSSQSENENLLKTISQLSDQLTSKQTENENLEKAISQLSDQITSSQSENENLQKTISQLRKVGRKYKTQYDELKAEFDQFKENQSKIALTSSTADTSESKEQIEARNDEMIKKIDELGNKIQELEQQNEKLMNDLTKVNEEKEEAKAQANEKEEKTKRIAHHAKLRIASITSEKNNLIREKEEFEKTLDELQQKIRLLEQNAEESALRLASFKSQFDSKMNRKERELNEANAQIEELKLNLQAIHTNQSQPQTPLHQKTPTIGVTAAVQSSSQSSVTPVRHSVHPQQSVSTKSTPTASIKPLAIRITHAQRSPRASVSQTRTATVATVQPTTEESVAHQSVPHATVQPTQTSQCNLVVVAPTANTEQPEIITAINEEEFREANEEQNLTETNPQSISITCEQIDDIMPTTVQESNLTQIEFDNRDSDSSNQDIGSGSEPIFLMQDIKDKTTVKRGLNESDDDSTSKKQRMETELEGIRPDSDENSHQKNIHSDNKSKYSTQTSPEFKEFSENVIIDRPNINEDDDEIIILSDGSADEKVKSEPEDVEEDEEEIEDEEDDDDEPNADAEDYYDEPNADPEVDASDDGLEQEEHEEFNEEVSNDDEEARDDRSDSNRYNDEDVEIIASDVPEDDNSRDEINDNSSENHHNINESEERNEENNVSVAPIRHNQPFIQIPTPIQRQFVRQSFFHHQTQSTYDEGDGIVPSTPTLIVPRRDDSFQEALNSPRVPQSRFVFSSSIQESSTLSQLETEETLGVDDTRMDLSGLSENNGQ